MVSRTSRLGLSKVTLPLLLALDIGSTASRGSLYDVTGRPIRPRAKTPHAFTTATDGTSTIDPDQVVDEVIGLISELVDLADGLPIAEWRWTPSRPRWWEWMPAARHHALLQLQRQPLRR